MRFLHYGVCGRVRYTQPYACFHKEAIFMTRNCDLHVIME
uniref:Uncharacterized protein n=1 Tax=Rhizophora mucronata TaxID=61149 RepID=A0A2P2PK93_RHIMU